MGRIPKRGSRACWPSEGHDQLGVGVTDPCGALPHLTPLGSVLGGQDCPPQGPCPSRALPCSLAPSFCPSPLPEEPSPATPGDPAVFIGNPHGDRGRPGKDSQQKPGNQGASLRLQCLGNCCGGRPVDSGHSASMVQGHLPTRPPEASLLTVESSLGYLVMPSKGVLQ